MDKTIVFSPEDLRAIMLMCDHERDLVDTLATMIPGAKTKGAHAHIAALASKAEQMLETAAKADAPAKESALKKVE